MLFNKAKIGAKFRPPAEADLSNWEVELPQTWKLVSIAEVTDCLDSARIPVKRENRARETGHYPYYGANGIVDYMDKFLFDGEFVLVTEDETFFGRTKPIAYRVSGKCWVNNHAHILSLNDSIDANYICYCLMYYNVIPWLTGTTGRAKLTQGVLNSLPIGYAPRYERIEIVRRVEALFAIADRLEARAQSALARYSRLTPALLAKAFRGELVPQDPTDEPASVLLERIRAQREEKGPVKRAGGRGRRPGVTTPIAAAGAGAEEAQSEPKRGRGRPRKVQEEAGQTSRGIPVAASAEEAIRLLQERARAEREGRETVQAGLFGN